MSGAVPLNSPPMAPPPGFSPPTAEGFLTEMPMLPDRSPAGVDAAVAAATQRDMPVIEPPADTTVELPVGVIMPDGRLITEATVRELTGYDEEKLSRIDTGNIARFVTELLSLAVEKLGDYQPPNPEMFRSMLVGDRDALTLGIRRVTYGDEMKFTLDCTTCGERSDIEIDLIAAIPVTKLDDPMQRVFDVELRRGRKATITLINGAVQERISEAIVKNKTSAEVNTIILAHSLLSIDGKDISDKTEAVKRLSSGDRSILLDFISEHAPGPQFGDVKVPCAACGEEYPVVLSLLNLFRA